MSDDLTEAASGILTTCRRELGADAVPARRRTYDRCNEPAEFILWGKLFPNEALGPRCYDCALEQIGDHHALAPNSGYALVDLRPIRRALKLADQPSKEGSTRA